jgi:hypothetical protein
MATTAIDSLRGILNGFRDLNSKGIYTMNATETDLLRQILLEVQALSLGGTVADGSITAIKIADANVTPAKLSQPFTAGTPVETTSGVVIDFTSIPSWAKWIALILNGVSTSGLSNYLVQIGSGSVDATGYNSVGQRSAGSFSGEVASTAGFVINVAAGISTPFGTFTFFRQTGNTWVASGVFSDPVGISCYNSNGVKSLSGALDRVRLTTANGTDTFDAGSANIFYG